jgi:hypothetical protein
MFLNDEALKAQRTLLAALLSECLRRNVLTEAICKERLEAPILTVGVLFSSQHSQALVGWNCALSR